MRYVTGVLALSLMLTSGCVIIANCDKKDNRRLDLPSGAERVAGGFNINYTVPEDGTVILVDETSNKNILSVSLGQGEQFDFSVANASKKYFGQQGVNLDKANFVLYFYPKNPEIEEPGDASESAADEAAETGGAAEEGEGGEMPAEADEAPVQ